MDQDGRHRELQRIAGRQWDILTIEQLRVAGFSDTEVQGLLRRGLLHRRYRGIYTYATDRPHWKGVLLAAQWSCGEDAYLTGRTALALAKVGQAYLGRIEVTVPRRSVRARQPPIALRRTNFPPVKEELRRDGPLNYAAPPRAMLDLAAGGADAKTLKRLITDAIHASRLRHPEMRALLERHRGQPGSATLTEAYRAYLPRPRAKSGLERSFDKGLATRPYLPEPERNIHMEAGGIPWEIDRYFADYRVAVELQGGPYHDADPDTAKDELKAAKLLGLGIHLFAVSDTRWEVEPEAVLDDLEEVLLAHGWRGRARAA